MRDQNEIRESGSKRERERKKRKNKKNYDLFVVDGDADVL